jgi:uncharacterized protein
MKKKAPWRWFRLPSARQLKKNRYLAVFGRFIHAGYLWHFHRHNVARAVAIGLFCACLPMPFQMVPAAALAIFFRAHLPVAVALVWISNPVTMPFIFYLQYHLGVFIMRKPEMVLTFKASFHWLASQFSLIWQPLLLGAAVMGGMLSAGGYFMTKICWSVWIRWRWHRRHP